MGLNIKLFPILSLVQQKTLKLKWIQCKYQIVLPIKNVSLKITSMLQLEVSVESSESFKVTPKDKSF